MPGARVLIVEDDAIIARHIHSILKKNGYKLDGVASSADQAVQKASESVYDLVLMDISLDGTHDGIEAAAKIKAAHDIPVIYLTALADTGTLQRAKVTDPFGYIIKPFEERTLTTNIEMALNKHSLERQLRESEERFRTLVENQGEGMVIVNTQEKILFANPALEAILGVEKGDAVGHSFLEFLETTLWPVIAAETEKRTRGISSKYEIEITRQNGDKRSVQLTVTPWMKDNKFAGSFALIQDITERKKIEQAERDQRALAEALYDTAATLNSTLNLDEVLNRILANVGRVVPHDGANIVLLEEGSLKIARQHGRFLDGSPQPIVVGGEAEQSMKDFMEHNQPITFPDLHAGSIQGLHLAFTWVRSYAGAPIRIRGRSVGMLNLGSETPHFFTPRHLERLRAFADQAALAIENARLYQESQQRARFLTLLNRITQAAIQTSTLEHSLHVIAGLLREVYDSDGIYITLWEEERQLTIPTAANGYTEKEYPYIRHDPGDRTLTRSALELGRPLVANDVLDTPYLDPELAKTFPLKSILCIPLIADTQKLGAILVGFRTQHMFSKAEVAQGEEISSQVSLAISRLRLYAQIQKLSITDDLTGLLNRRGIFELGRRLVTHSLKNQEPLSMIWLDIDRFKEINDSYGHPVGDEVICVIADRCRNSVKGRDLVGRYGGEGGDELIILLVETDLDQALTVAERLRLRILNYPITTQSGVIQVTVSLGVTTYQKGENLSHLLSRADQAMYSAKSAGRNCVFMLK